MPETWIKVYQDGKLSCTTMFDRAIVLGRQNPNEELYVAHEFEQQWRLAFAAEPQTKIPRNFVQLEPLRGGIARITNLHAAAVFRVDGGPKVLPETSLDVRLGSLLVMDQGFAIRLEEETGDLRGVNTATLAPTMRDQAFRSGMLGRTDAVDSTKLIQWFQAIIFILQRSTSADELFQNSVDAVVNLLGMDNGAVALCDATSGKWITVKKLSASRLTPNADEWTPSQRILAAVRSRREVLYQVPPEVKDRDSMKEVQCVVVAPILAENGTVIGALYGDRRTGQLDRPDVSQLDGQLVQTIACAIATGLVRVESERKGIAAQTRFEQFFTVELARSLTADPRLLEGRDAEVTCLFADIRGFSRVSEKLSAQEVMAWIQEVMSVLSNCVVEQNGVLIDYIGDELFAMWGAPEEQPDHAERACAAARAMLKCLPALNEQWRKRLGSDFSVGMGIHTGKAHVGNTGSTIKFKYGPLGNTVNLASRIQGATKYLRTGLLVTQHTRKNLPQSNEFRRLCKIRVVNIDEPVELYDLPIEADANWHKLKDCYEAALTAYEAGDYRLATRRLTECLEIAPDDGPTVLLLSRSVMALGEGTCDDVWTLPGK